VGGGGVLLQIVHGAAGSGGRGSPRGQLRGVGTLGLNRSLCQKDSCSLTRKASRSTRWGDGASDLGHGNNSAAMKSGDNNKPPPLFFFWAESSASCFFVVFLSCFFFFSSITSGHQQEGGVGGGGGPVGERRFRAPGYKLDLLF